VLRNNLEPTILAVDDEPHVLRTLRTILERHGYRLRMAPNGPMALDAISSERPDLVLLDLAMPYMNGVEVCRRIRSFSRLPILVLSALVDEPQKVEALDAGADDYITKPFGVDELLARIRAALRRAQAQGEDAAVIRAGGIEIDQIGRRVIVDGRDVHLTPTQYDLLRMFVMNADRLLTQRALLVGAFGPHYEDAVDDLRSFIFQLRQKIESDPARPKRIVTEPGLGYRLRSND